MNKTAFIFGFDYVLIFFLSRGSSPLRYCIGFAEADILVFDWSQ